MCSIYHQEKSQVSLVVPDTAFPETLSGNFRERFAERKNVSTNTMLEGCFDFFFVIVAAQFLLVSKKLYSNPHHIVLHSHFHALEG